MYLYKSWDKFIYLLFFIKYLSYLLDIKNLLTNLFVLFKKLVINHDKLIVSEDNDKSINRFRIYICKLQQENSLKKQALQL